MAYVALWFDCEDYVTPESDDATLRLAELLSDLGIRGTFKFVGERARVLRRRGRRDVIGAVRRHDIGYHTDFHSRRPTVAEYLEGKSWHEGVIEFVQRESQGAKDVREILQAELSCYGQPGGSWAPHAYGALARMGIRLYLDEGGHVGLNEEPFWYCNTLNVFNLRRNTCRLSLREPDALPDAKRRVAEINDRLEREGGGLISIWYHPCEFATVSFWDGVNFARGADPPPGHWRAPPLKDRDEIERNFRDLREWLAYIRSLPGVEFVTGADILKLYPDPAEHRSLAPDQLMALARSLTQELSFVRMEDVWVSPAEAFSALVRALSASLRDRPLPDATPLQQPLGPTVEAGVPATRFVTSWAQVWDGCRRAARALRSTGHVPAEVSVGRRATTPESLLSALAGAVVHLENAGSFPDRVRFAPAALATAAHVADDSPSLWTWVIFPPGFTAPRSMALAKRQAWTLKPARAGAL